MKLEGSSPSNEIAQEIQAHSNFTVIAVKKSMYI